MNDIRVAILAAGKGTRMDTLIPKPLIPLAGRPLIDHLLEAIRLSGIDEKPLVIVGHQKEKLIDYLGDRVEYIVQEPLLGTGHAVQQALSALSSTKHLLVFYADHPFVTPLTIQKIYKKHLDKKEPVTLAILKLEHFNDPYETFFHFGRISRSSNGLIERIIEKKDANEKELQIHEVNPGYYAFDIVWLQNHLKKLTNQNIQNEYYLTDLVELAIKEGRIITEVFLSDPLEAMGMNTKGQHQIAEKLFISQTRSL